VTIRSPSQRAGLTAHPGVGQGRVTEKLPSPWGDLLSRIETEGRDLSREQIPSALGELERVKASLAVRLMAPASPASEPDRLLTVEEAADRLGLAIDTLYRKAKAFPFAVRLPGRQVRFSAAGIEKFIRSRQGR
jgi:excisionase family DNA binding protein